MRIKIGTKLIAAFVLILTLMVALALYLMNESHQSLEESVGRSSVFLAEEMLKRMNHGIYLKIEELQSRVNHLMLQESLSESNREFQKLANIEEYINQKDSEWVSAPKDEITPFMQELITRDLSNHLRGDFIEFHHKKYGYKTIVELFVTNRYGANVAQSGKTSDYRQDDEEWWQIAREKGHYISDVEYDESTDESAISLGMRIDDEEGNFIGVMKAVVAVKSIIRSAEIAEKRYETTRIKLITKDGRLIYRTRAFKFLEDVSDKTFFKQLKGEKGFFIAKAGRRERLYSYARSKGYRDFEGLGWILVVGHDVQEILKPVFKLRKSMVVASLILITIAVIITFLMSRAITKPIAILTKGTEIIGKGDLEHRVDVKTKDEIGVLANTFNNMVADLKKITASRDELNKEITERKKAEESLKAANQQLTASNQQLRATEQQLKAANQQLDASNQQLRASEQELRKHREHLDEMVEKRTNELKDAQEQLIRKKKLAVLGQLAGGMGHELRNPLGVISNAIYYLNTTLPDADETTREYLEIITSEVKNSEKIVSDLLGISRTRPAEREKIALSELVTQVLQKQPPPEGVKVVTEIAPDLPPVYIDPRQIGQVLVNLLTNSYQAMASSSPRPEARPEGSVKMPEGGKLTIRGQSEKDKVSLAITDTGSGISKENMKKIFEPLFTTKARGIGLGLAVSKNLVEVNGGSIEVESPSTEFIPREAEGLGTGKGGKGSTFTVILSTKEVHS